MRTAAPALVVLLGGLLLGCPTAPPAVSPPSSSSSSGGQTPPPMVGHGVGAGGVSAAPPPPPGGGGLPPVDAQGRGDVQPGAGIFTMLPPTTTEPARAGALCPGCDVVLITVCSLRKDHVSAYGAGLAQTPAIDRLAAEGVRFERAYAASNFTLASLTAVLTGRFGSSTGVTGWDKGLVRDIRTLPEILGYYGYRTAAFTTDAPSGFRPDYGLDRGFQHMEIYPPPPGTPDGRYRGGTAEAGATAAPVVAWLAAQPADDLRPLFVMFHSRTAHFPFVVSQEGVTEDATGMTRLLWEAGMGRASAASAGAAMPGMAGGTAQQGIVEFGPDPLHQQVSQVGAPAVEVWRQHYARAVERMDADVARVWAALEARGRLDRTIVALIADHGESLNEHGELLHGDAYFDGVVNVPFLLRVPGLSGGQVQTALISQVDVAPTLLDLVGAVPPVDADGVSAVPLLRGTATAVRHTALAEGGVARREDPHPVGAVFAPPWSLLRQDRGCGDPGGHRPAEDPTAPPTCLFHMDDDPGQIRSVAAAHPEVVADLLGRWEGFRQNVGAQPDASVTLSPAFVDELRRNGYDFRLAAPPPAGKKP